MAAFKSPFEKLSYEAQDSMAKSVNPGGALYSLLERLVNASEISSGGVVSGGKVNKEALAAIEGLALASKRMAGAIAIIAAAKPKDVEKFFGVFTQLKKTLLEDLTEEDSQEMMKQSMVLGHLADAILNFGQSMAIFAAMTPIILFGATSFFLTMRIIKLAMGGDFLSNVFGVFIEDQIGVFADNIMRLGLVLVAYAALSPIILIGALAFWTTIAILKGALNRLGANSGAPALSWFSREIMGKKGALLISIDNVRRLAYSILVFGTVMSLATPFLIIGLIGSIAFYFTINNFLIPAIRKLGDKRRAKTFKNAIVHSGLILATMILLLPTMLMLGVIGLISPLIALGALVISFAMPLISKAFAGMGKLLSQVAQGALVVALIGLSLIPLAFGLLIFAQAFKATDSPWEFMGWTIALTSGLGLAMTGLGVVVALTAGAAFLGPLMIAAIGGSLIALAEGLKRMKDLDFTEEDAAKLTTTLAGVKAAFMGTEGNPGGFFAKLKGALSGAMDSVKIIAAAAGYAAAGMALTSLSKGLTAYKELKWDDEDSLSLTNMLVGVSAAFAAAGGQDQVQAGGLLGKLTGMKVSKTEEGIRSVLKAGDALTGIATGLIGFKKLIDSKIKFGTPDANGNYEEGTMGHAVTTTMSFVNKAFAAIGEQGNVQGGGFFDTLFQIKRNKVEEGIRSVQGAGDALSGIANGLMGFQKLVQSKIVFGTFDKATGTWTPGSLGEAVTNTMAFVQTAFASIADAGNVEASGFWGSVFSYEKNKVQEGIDSVKGAGAELEGIANGLLGFQKLVKSKIVFGTYDKATKKWTEGSLGEAVTNTMSFVQTAFAAIADGGKTEQSGFWGSLFGIEQSKVKEGIESVQGAGDVLNKIADGLNKFKGIEDTEGTSQKISDVVKIVSTAFEKVSKMDDTEEAVKLIEATAKAYKDISKSSNEMNIEAISTTARMFEALGYLTQVGGDTAIEQLGQSLVDAIAELAEMIANFEGSVNDAAASNDGLGDKIGGFMDSLSPFKSDESQGTSTTPSSSGGSSSGGSSINVDQTALIAEIKRLQSILVSGDAVVQVDSSIL